MDTQPLSDEESGMYEFPHLPVETPVLNLETAAPEVLEETTMDQEAVIEAASGEAVREAASPEAVPEEMEPKGSFEWFEEFDQVYSGTPPDPVPIPGDAMTADSAAFERRCQTIGTGRHQLGHSATLRVERESPAAQPCSQLGGLEWGESFLDIQGLPLNPKASPKASASTPEPVATVAIEESTMRLFGTVVQVEAFFLFESISFNPTTGPPGGSSEGILFNSDVAPEVGATTRKATWRTVCRTFFLFETQLQPDGRTWCIEREFGP